MKKILLQFILLVCFISPQLCFSAEGTEESSTEGPNIIFIMADDLGKNMLSLYNARSEIKTPNLERLAKEGVVFNNAYATFKCTPTRAELISGRYGWNNNIMGNIFKDAYAYIKDRHSPRAKQYMSTRYTPSFALPLQQSGYTTAIVGKWHLGNYYEKPRMFRTFGFDRWMISVKNNSLGAYTDQGFVVTSGFHPEKLADFVIDFITEHKDEPFFIYYLMHLPHSPFVITPLAPDAETLIEKVFSNVEYIDFSVGRIMQTLEELNLKNRTIIFFAGDNGSHFNDEFISRRKANMENFPHKHKGTLYETGVNVPLIVSGGPIIKRGATDALLDFTDILPTLADFASIPVIRKRRETKDDYEGIAGEYVEVAGQYKGDGYSVMPFLTGQTDDTPRTWIISMHKNRTVIRDQKFKLWAKLVEHRLRGYAFYDLYKDPDETNNLYDSDVSTILKARRRLQEILNDMYEPGYVKTQIGRVDRNYGMLTHWPMDRSELLTNTTRLIDIEGGYDTEDNAKVIFNEQGKFGDAIEANRLLVPYSKGLFYNFIVGDNNILFRSLKGFGNTKRETFSKRFYYWTYKQIRSFNTTVLELINTIYNWIYSDEYSIHGEEKFHSSMTVSAWLQTPKPDQPIYLLKQPYIDDDDHLMSLAITKEGTISFELSTDDQSYRLESSVLDKELWDRWMHIAATWDGRKDCGKARLYMNGKKLAKTCMGKLLSADDADDLLIGGFTRESSTNDSIVLIDDIAIWRQPLTSMEIDALYSLGNRFAYNASDIDSLFNAPDGSAIKVANRLWRRIPMEDKSTYPTIRELPDAIEIRLGKKTMLRSER